MVATALILNWMSRVQGDESTQDILSQEVDEKPETFSPIQNLMRVTRNGLECKRIVDRIIDANAECVNLRRIVGEWHEELTRTRGSDSFKRAVSKGI